MFVRKAILNYRFQSQMENKLPFLVISGCFLVPSTNFQLQQTNGVLPITIVFVYLCTVMAVLTEQQI